MHSGHDDIGKEAMEGETPKLHAGDDHPGSLGGVIAPMATDGKTVFVPVVNCSLTLRQQKSRKAGPGNGELVALDLATGKVEVERNGHAGLRLRDRGQRPRLRHHLRRHVSAFDTKTGSVVWREKLPAGTNSGVTAAGDMLIAPAGVASAEGQTAKIVAYSSPNRAN